MASRFRFPVLLISGLVLLGAGAGGALWGLRHSSALQALLTPAQAQEKSADTLAKSKPVPPPAPVPIFVKLDPFTVTLRNEGDSRVLYIGMTIQAADQASAKRLDQYMPAVRNRILMVLAKQTPDAVTHPETMDAIKGEVLDTLEPAFEKGAPAQKLRAVLFTAYVVQ